MLFVQRLYIILLFSVLVMVGCETPPNLPDTPSIEYISLDKVRDSNGDDSIAFTIRYQDGNGDLGLDPDDTDPPFQPTDPMTGNPNFYHYNFHIVMYEKQGGSYVLFTPNSPGLFDSTALDGRFPRLLESDNDKVIEGNLTYGLQTFSKTSGKFDPNDTLRFEVKIVDRALNISNTITTKEIVVNTP